MCPSLPNVESPTTFTLESGVLHIATSDFDARPMSYLTPTGERLGYEPALTRLICRRLDLVPVWHNLPMAEFYTCLATGKYDVVWFNQAITPARQQVVTFTRPYGLFDEAVLVGQASGIQAIADLSGKRIAGLADSTNIALVDGWPGTTAVPFPGSDQVLPEMLAALRAGEVDAVIDDELVLVAAAEADDSLEIAFTLPTKMPFAIATPPGRDPLRQALDQELEMAIADGSLAQLWAEWIPWKPFPFS